MEKFRNLVEDALNEGDPEVRTWFLVQNNYLPFILCGIYAVFSTHLGPAIMKNRKPFHLRAPMILFNFSLVFIYTICLFIILWNLQHLAPGQFCKEDRVKKDNISYLMIRTLWVCYILKYVEFFDTVFFVLRKKRNLITLLHLVHHSVAPIIYWVLFRTERSATAGIPGLLNTMEHIVMYFYYGLAAMGPSVRQYLWWKKYVTQFQMMQFILIVLYMTVTAPLLGCKIGFLTYTLHIIFPLFFLYLFYRMYVAKFHSKKKKDGNIDEIIFEKRLK